MSTFRRQTLGPVSGSNLNSRPSLGRPSLGGRKASLGVYGPNRKRCRRANLFLGPLLPLQGFSLGLVLLHRRSPHVRS